MRNGRLPVPWERQPNETEAAFHAFTHYRDLPPRRSKDEAYRRHRLECVLKVDARLARGEITHQRAEKLRRETGAKQAPGTWEIWAQKYEWVKRVAAWENELDKDRRAKRIRALRQVQDDLVTIARAARTKIWERLRQIEAREIPLSQLPMFLKIVTELELQALKSAEQEAKALKEVDEETRVDRGADDFPYEEFESILADVLQGQEAGPGPADEDGAE